MTAAKSPASNAMQVDTKLVRELAALGLKMMVVESHCRHLRPLRHGERVAVHAYFGRIDHKIMVHFEVRSVTHGHRAARGHTALVTLDGAPVGGEAEHAHRVAELIDSPLNRHGRERPAERRSRPAEARPSSPGRVRRRGRRERPFHSPAAATDCAWRAAPSDSLRRSNADPDNPNPTGRYRCRGCGRGTWSGSACRRRG